MRRGWVALVAIAMAVALTRETSAHKPITSPFTYSADVLPIVRARCGQCHAPGGVAPMSLLTYADTVPWGESLRLELTAGHMPPWSVDRGARRFHSPGNLTGREMNVLLTWATGGTPPGEMTGAEPRPVTPAWSNGQPDLVLSLPSFTLAAEEQERVADFVVATPPGEHRLRAVDLLPGTPAIVRSATIEIQQRDRAGIVQDERKLAVWVPGDDAAPVGVGAFKIASGQNLLVRVRYRKTWEYERKAMTDQSRVGLYFAGPATPLVAAVTVVAGRGVTLSRTVRAVAVYTDANISDTSLAVTATKPDGRRDELIAFHPRRGWARRFWLREPLTLPRGTILTLRAVPDPPALLPSLAVAPQPASPQPATPRVTINVIE